MPQPEQRDVCNDPRATLPQWVELFAHTGRGSFRIIFRTGSRRARAAARRERLEGKAKRVQFRVRVAGADGVLCTRGGLRAESVVVGEECCVHRDHDRETHAAPLSGAVPQSATRRRRSELSGPDTHSFSLPSGQAQTSPPPSSPQNLLEVSAVSHRDRRDI